MSNSFIYDWNWFLYYISRNMKCIITYIAGISDMFAFWSKFALRRNKSFGRTPVKIERYSKMFWCLQKTLTYILHISTQNIEIFNVCVDGPRHFAEWKVIQTMSFTYMLLMFYLHCPNQTADWPCFSIIPLKFGSAQKISIENE